MQFSTTLESLSGQSFHGSVVTIGNFDGLHRGHRALLAAAGRAAGRRVVVTFRPHPVQVLYPERNVRRLLPAEDLRERLPAFGIDLLLEIPFTRAFAALSADEFLNRYLGEPFRPSAVVAGYDFGFGKAREGSLPLLRDWCERHGATLTVCEPLEDEGGIVSSRRLRGLVEAGDVATARRLLERPFYLRGRVGHGAGRGATIGVPTLNQIVENETLPRNGVYATRVRADGEEYASVTNVGLTPTFGDAPQIKVETHVIDRVVDWRERTIDVDFYARLRDERKFAGVSDLTAQIARDVAAARTFDPKGA